MAELPIVERLRGRKDGDVALTCREVIEAAELIEALYEALGGVLPHLTNPTWEMTAEQIKAISDARAALALAKGEKQG
jgi:hypothetical protein